MIESFASKLLRWKFNFFPAYRNSGARVVAISADFLEILVQLELTRKTKNYVGTLFGGSMYAAVDPIYMMMLIKCLGPDYIVWDKAATIEFKKPGRTTLYATFKLDVVELNTIKSELAHRHSIDRIYPVDLVDDAGVVHASFLKTVYIRKKHKEKESI